MAMHRISLRCATLFLLYIWSPRIALKTWLPVSALLRRLARAARPSGSRRAPAGVEVGDDVTFEVVGSEVRLYRMELRIVHAPSPPPKLPPSGPSSPPGSLSV